jgi:diguanylate cyclase (GGDEF)-like protein
MSVETNRFLNQSKEISLAEALALALLIALADYYTGYELSVGPFYLFPIFLVAWRVGRRTAMGFALGSAALWYAVDLGSGHIYSSPLVGYWDALMRLAYFVAVAYMAARLKEEQELHKSQARFDPLTSLLNRRGFLEAAEIECRRSGRTKSPLTLAYIDLDNFKAINDKYGHSMGDEVLRVVGHALRSHCRASDTVGRLGGDEFALLLPESDMVGAKVFLENLRGHLLKAMQGRGWSVTFSIGSISFMRSVSVEEMILRADALMYEVKHGPKGKINFDRSSGEFYTQGAQTL